MAHRRTPKPTTVDSTSGRESRAEGSIFPDTREALQEGNNLYCPKCSVWYDPGNGDAHAGH